MEEQTLYWWIDHVSTVLSIPLAVIGFGVTIWQLVKTRNSAAAALEATEATQKQIRRLSVASLLPQLHRIDEELHSAVERESVELALFWIRTWQREAGVAKGLLSEMLPAESKIMTALQSSIVAAAGARGDMLGIDAADLQAATLTVRKRVIAVTSQLGELSAQQGMKTGAENGE